MPQNGDPLKAYCNKCDRETVWIYIEGNLCWWKCLGCGRTRLVGVAEKEKKDK